MARDDLITMGRVGVDLYPEQIGVALEDVSTFAKSLGGSPTNVAVAASRLGASAAVITKVGDDPFGVYCRRALAGSGSTTAGSASTRRCARPWRSARSTRPTTSRCSSTASRGAGHGVRGRRARPRRDPRGADPVDDRHGLSQEPSRAATLAALEARDGRRRVIHDLDHRPMFWADPAEAARWPARRCAFATVAVGNREEVEVAVGTRDPTRPPTGCSSSASRSRSSSRARPACWSRTRGGPDVEVPPVPTEVVYGLGAGDAFGGSLAYGLLQGWPPERAVRMANAAGSIVASRLACADAMPTLEELEGVLA